MRYTASHSVLCNAAQDRVYDCIRRSADWPGLFEPCMAVTVIASEANYEHIEVTARVNGAPITWQSQRRFLPEVFGIESSMVKPIPLVKAMNTSWRVVMINCAQSVLVLEHCYDLCDDVLGVVQGIESRSDAENYIAAAIDKNSETELGNIKAALEFPIAEQPVALDRSARHSVVCNAAAERVYSVIRNTGNWPKIFDACLRATRIEGDERGELVRIDALQDGQHVSWNTRREYFDDIHRIDYHLPVPMPFLATMTGQWRVVPLGSDRCLLTVERFWRLLPDVSGIRAGIFTVRQAASLVDSFINENSEAEMQSIRASVEGRTESLVSFFSSYRLPYSPDEVYGVLADVSNWALVLPHCKSISVIYDDSQYQEFIMGVDTPRGPETFRSIRQCDSDALSIRYFQPQPPALLRKHCGSWQVRGADGGCEIVAHHTVLLDDDACTAAFGDSDAGLHKRRIRELIELNSRKTVNACASWLEVGPDRRYAAAPAYVCHE